MKYQRLLSRVFGTPLMIERGKLDAVLSALAPRAGFAVQVSPDLQPEQMEPKDRKPYRIDGGVAIIDVSGTHLNRATGLDALSGLTSYEELGNEIMDAATDPAVSAILLRFDSYGGEANGAWDLADMIRQAGALKPVWASVDDYALSAGYLMASAANKIYVTRTSGVGSIGVIALHVDQSSMDSTEGLKYTAVFAGSRKNDMTPHEPLADGARESLRSEVNRLYSMFVRAVATHRGLLPEAVSTQEAAIFYGKDGISAGLADGVATFRQVLASMKANVAAGKFQKTERLTGMQTVMADVIPGNLASAVVDVVASAGAPPSGETQAESALEATPPPQDPVPAGEDPPAVHGEPEPQAHQDAVVPAAVSESAPHPLVDRREVAEIVDLCVIARHPELASEFVAAGASAEDVRKKLLGLRAASDADEGIQSFVRPESIGNTGRQTAYQPGCSPIEKAAEALAMARTRKEQ